jgi:hypothetical protein
MINCEKGMNSKPAKAMVSMCYLSCSLSADEMIEMR